MSMIFNDLKEDDYGFDYDADYRKALPIQKANTDIEELKAYRTIGTLKEFMELKAKATAKKPIHNGHGVFFCPKCHGTVWQIPSESHYCFRCGTALDWSEGKE